MRHAFRDFFRRRRLARHVASHGDWYDYHGIPVEVPPAAGLGVRNALLKQKYEGDEAAMILKHLPADLPVIELGGSLGVVSALIRSRLQPGMRHLVVEANPELIGICTANASRQAEVGMTEIVNAALFYDGPLARMNIDSDVHSSALEGSTKRGRLVDVPAVTLGQLGHRLGGPYALVSDIEGGEYPIFEKDAPSLAQVRLAILEIHPQAYARAGGSEAALLDRCRELGFFEIDRQADVVVFSSGASPRDSR